MASHRLVRHELSLVEFWVLGLVAINAVLNLATELSNETLDGPGGGVSQRADSVTLNLVGELLKHVNLSEVGISELHALEHVHHPACALTARCALAATLVLVELGQAQNGVDHISLIVHHDDSSGTKT